MKALVVDDCAVARELLVLALENYTEVDQVESGVDAVKMVEAALDSDSPYDLICMDLNMPGMTGHDALRLIRQKEADRSSQHLSKIFMVTASSSPDDMMEALLAGDCDDYLTKPVLMNTLKELLQKHQIADPVSLKPSTL